MTEYLLDRPGTTDEVRATRAELVARAHGLIPLLAQNAERTEQGRRVVEENITAIRDAGLFRVTLPRRFGGFEADIRTLMDVTRELGRGCGSTGWVTALLNGGNFAFAQFCDKAQRDVWADNPDNLVAVSFTPTGSATRVDGGYRISGRWGWASGSLHAQWAGVGATLPPDSNPEFGPVALCMVPMTDLSIDDTWFVAGMRGTGSNTLVAENVFVPHHRVTSPAQQLQGKFDTEFKDEKLYRSSLVGFAVLSIIGPQLGLAVSALDLVVDKAPKRAISYSDYQSQAEAPTVQLAVAEAAMHIDAAHLLAYRAAADTDQAAEDGVFPDYNSRARIHANGTAALVHSREAIRILLSAHGASAFGELNPLQRVWRDAEVASRHGLTNAPLANEVYGRGLLGIQEGVTAFV